MEWFLAWPALAKVSLCFLLVVASSRFKVNLGLALAGAGALLGLAMGLGPVKTGLTLLQGATSPRTLSLALLVALILALSQLLKQSGQLDRMVEAFRGLVRSPRAVAAAMPAVIGLLPMPGGALFSAPMVDASCRCGEHQAPGPGLLTAINYWFRHHGEMWWPIYPGFILAVSLLQLPPWLFLVTMLPLVVVHLAAGTWFLLRPLKLEQAPPPASEDGRWRRLIRETMPILIVVAVIPLSALVSGIFDAAGVKPPWPSGAPLILGLAAACWQVALSNQLGGAAPLKALARRDTLGMLALILGIMSFQAMMAGSGAVGQIQSELVGYGVPLLAMIAVLPFISGVVTGIAVGFVGASFPLVVPLFSDLTGTHFLAHAVLAYTAGFIGMLLSPVHLCLLVTKDYFHESFRDAYRRIAWPLVCLGLAAGLWYLVLV